MSIQDNDLVRDIYQKLGGIEAKIDDVRSIRDTANEANTTAKTALRMAESHEEEFKEMRKESAINRRWLIGLIVTVSISIVGGLFTLFQVLNP